MSTVYEIPLSPQAQTFTISLAGTQYVLTFKWNTKSTCWVLDIADASNNPILSGVPLVTGADLLEQFGYLDFGGKLVAQTDNDALAVPTFANLGTNGHLYFAVL